MSQKLLKCSFIFIITLFASCFLIAGTEVGNGGDVIVCTNGPTETVEFFDVYESRVLRGWKPNLGSAQLSVKEKVDLALTRLELPNTNSQGLAEELKNYANDFWVNSNFVSDSELTDVSDTFAVVIPVNCKLKQLALQLFKPSIFDKRYVINNEFWMKLSSDDQAAFILHEIIYRKAIQQGATNSIGTRLINSIIFSDTVSKINMDQWIQVWRQADFRYINIGKLGFKMDLNENLFVDLGGYINGKAYSNSGSSPATVKFKNLELIFNNDALFESDSQNAINAYKISENKIMAELSFIYLLNQIEKYFMYFRIVDGFYMNYELNLNYFCFENLHPQNYPTVQKFDSNAKLLRSYYLRQNQKICFDYKGTEVVVPSLFNQKQRF